MATHLTGQYSPSSRKNSPSRYNSQNYHPSTKLPQSARDHHGDRSLPSRRYPQYEHEPDDHNVANRQSIPPPSHRANLTSTSPHTGNSSIIDRSELRASSETMKNPRPINSNTSNDITGSEDLKKKQEDIFKNILEVVTDISSLKVENKKAIVLFETSKEKYERTTCHHSRFPNLKTTLQNELDKAKESVEKINEELCRRDVTLRELAGQSLPILLPAIQAYRNESNQKPEDPKILEKLENVISKSEQQYSDLKQELGRFKEEQRKYQTLKDKQLATQETQLKVIKSTQLEKEKLLASQEIQLKEIKSSQQEKDSEIAKLRSQLRTLNDELSILRKEKLDTLGQIELVRDKFNSTHKETIRISAHLAETIGKNLEKFKSFESQFQSLASVKSGFKMLRDNGLLDLKASTVEDISTTLKVAVGRIDSLPSAASYFSLNSRLETLEKEINSEPHKKEIIDLLGLQIQNRLIALENEVVKNQEINSESVKKEITELLGLQIQNRLIAIENEVAKKKESPASSEIAISTVEEKIDALSKKFMENSNPSKTEEELQNLRVLIGELQRSLNIVRINVAGLHERTQSATNQSYDDTKMERMVEVKTRKFVAETFRKISEVSQMLAATNHSVENLMSRVDNVTTGHLAQAILNQLSETYPHIQTVEQLYITQGKQLRDLQSKVDNLSDVKADFLALNQSTISTGNNFRNLGNEVDKISEDIFKTNQNIKKLTTALEDERKSIIECLTSKLDGLVSSDNLHTYKTQLDTQIQTLVEKCVEEYTKKTIVPQLDKASTSLDIEAFNKYKSGIESSLVMVEKNASKISEIEDKISSMRAEIVNRVTNKFQEQNGGLSELIATHVDRSFATKKPDFVKEVTKYLELKESSNSRSTHNSPSHVPSNKTTEKNSLSPNSSQKSKRKFHDIKSESSHRSGSPTNKSIGNKKNRLNSTA